MGAAVTDNERGITSQAIEAVSSAVRILPPAFVVLVLLNVVFLGVQAVYLHRLQEDRVTLTQRLLDSCTIKGSRP